MGRNPSSQQQKKEEGGEREGARRDGAGAYKWAVLNPRRKKSQPPQVEPRGSFFLLRKW
jgi:hypothetical protein